jgi:hypothetical protein
VPQAGSEPRPGHVQVADRSQTGRVQVTAKSRTGHRQVADRSRTGHRQVADRSQSKMGHRTTLFGVMPNRRWGLALLVLTDGRQRGCVASAVVNGRRAY